ncbi:LOW QUALITY PROTEIN: ES1 protein, mitochondrial-like [Pristis pectinata]|uniref:LOW QUALITY PROTEIN: ES1 protein, mitochondrial-like n=1 Tax=Pristis pectinata TaxID=685728 RepID=UPI00223E4695|nr:LOW QUALITY PROTEIN: ES1 protein, mitochondrial-like [Pristis pectinata]
MLASRAVLVKKMVVPLAQTTCRLVCQPSSLGNWGNTKVAVVFSGSGWWDGTDTHEAAYVIYHLNRNGAKYQIFAPNMQQMHVIDHTRNQPMSGDNRNVMTESARLTRGRIQDITSLEAGSYDAIIFPGGYGITKNLSTFHNDGKDCRLNSDIDRILKSFAEEIKPIGLSCMSTILACRVLPGIEVTMGYESNDNGCWPYYNMTTAIKNMGAKHVMKEPFDAHVDERNKVITTPASMWESDSHSHHIFDGIGQMVKHVLRMSNK